MRAAPAPFRGLPYTPIRLKRLLVAHGITRGDLAGAVHQAKDMPLSRSAVAQIINHGYYPRNTPEADIQDQIKAYLAARGVAEAERDAAFLPDAVDDQRYAIPLGAHLHPERAADRQRKKRPEKLAQQDFKPMEIEMLSPAAKAHFKLSRDPFLNDVAGPEDVFQSDSQRYVIQAMMQTALLGGITAVIGESGSGKTTLRKLLLNRIAGGREKIRVVFPRSLDKTRLSTGAICAAIVRDLEPDTKLKSGLEDQAFQVEDVLRRSRGAGNKHLLMIEEAHDLSIQTLKYLKRFWEVETNDGFSVSLGIVLVAQPEMRVKLDVARHPQAREFINRCEIASLGALHQQVGSYLAHKFTRLGMRVEDVFAADAVEAIRERWTLVDPHTRAVKTNLYPLIVNNTATKAMNRAAELGLPLVTGDLIKEL